MGVHDGHRERLRGSFLEHGLDNFNDVNALELLLFYAIPRRDTNEIAHALLDRFGSLDGVFHASEQELCTVPGIGSNTAALIMLLPQLMRKVEVSKTRAMRSMAKAQEAADYLIPRFLYEQDEMAVILCLDSMLNLINCIEISRGVVNSVNVDVRRTVELALRSKASYVILSHNHPNGRAMPSKEDDMVTSLLMKALDSVGIRLYDHIIVAGKDYASYRRTGFLDMYRY